MMTCLINALHLYAGACCGFLLVLLTIAVFNRDAFRK